MIQKTLEKIRRRENRFYGALHDFYRQAQRANVEYPRSVASFLLAERSIRRTAWNWAKTKFYCEPLFRRLCWRVGARMRLDGDLPLVLGDGRITLGDDVTIGNRCAFYVVRNLFEMPELIIGSRTTINWMTEISVECRVEIGDDCQIAGETKIFDNNSHAVHYRDGRRMTRADVAPIRIEDHVWIGMRSMILKGVTIGRGSVVAAGSIVTQDIPPMSIAAGIPARVVRSIEAGEGPAA
jgi:acetyltransferase-like isoleucine patch superfamily enzyme